MWKKLGWSDLVASVSRIRPIFVALNNKRKDTTMARPIKETPILVGTDAERFISEMQRVENLSKEVRTSNREKLMKLYNAAKKRITICM
jgi:hypothetical protein